MRFGSHKVPLRVALAGVSLLGLGVAAALPTVADGIARETARADPAPTAVDPIVTGTTDKVATEAPTQTQLPAPPDTATSTPPRQILPHAPEAALTSEVEPAPSRPVADTALQDRASDPVVSPTMTDQMAEADQLATSDELAMSDTGIRASTATLTGEASDAGGIVLALDHARVMRVVGDVSTIIIGNPSIADASMPDPGTIVLTGKSYGETNMVMLDQNGAILAEETLRVTVRGQSLVSVYRGVQRTTLSCAPTCEIRPTPGDAPETVTNGLSAFQARNQAALAAVRGE